MIFKDETILITGGTGSFGQYMTKWLLKNSQCNKIIIFSRDEEKQLDMRREIADERVEYEIGDVRDFPRVLEVTNDVDRAFHAAALKIIDTGELYPLEVIKTNIQGTVNVAKACWLSGVESAVLISTDKAVKPINLYGMTKGVAERVWMQYPDFSVARYGNVIGSRGSVIPFFQKLVKEGKPLPITSTEMTRFLLPLDRAMDTVMYAVSHPGVIAIPDIAAASILDIAAAVGGEDYPIEIIGVRQGEKIHECLINEDESRSIEFMPKRFDLSESEELTSDKARRLTVDEIKELIGND